MSPVMQARDRNFLIAVSTFVVVLVGLIIAVSPEQEELISYPSSYSAASKGAKAAFLLLAENDYSVERWQSPPRDLPNPGEGVTLILAEPFLNSKKEDDEALHRFLLSGGRVLAVGMSAGMMLPQSEVASPSYEKLGWTQYQPEIPSEITRGGAIWMSLPARWTSKSMTQLRHYQSGGDGIVVSYKIGKGDAIWWGSATPMTNAGITRDGNLSLFLNSVGANRRVLWDEYFHGSRPSLWSYASGTPLAWGLAQLGMIGVAVLLTFSRRSGPVRPLAQESRLSSLEFVETLGGLYQGAHASSIAVEVMYQRFCYLLSKRLGTKPDSTAAEMAHSVSVRLGYARTGFAETLQRCESAAHDSIPDKQALDLIQALHDYAHDLKLIQSPQEKN